MALVLALALALARRLQLTAGSPVLLQTVVSRHSLMRLTLLMQQLELA